jgi:ATP-dependent RNA helicase RhlB
VAEKLEGYLLANGFKAQALSGDVPQKKRLRFMREFHSGELAVLIATDVASRGLHIPDVSHVFNYDLPQDAADYVHRIGRTARAGSDGDAISFGCEEYAVSLPDIEDYISHKIPVARVTPDLLARELKPPVYKEWDPEDGPRPQHRHGGRHGGGRGGPRRGGGGGGGGRGGPRRSGGGGHRRGRS